MLNNPVRYTDPSGHYACEDERGNCRPPDVHPTRANIVNARIKIYYGITLKGGSLSDRENLLGALDNLNLALGGINEFTSGTTYSFTSNPKNYGGWTSGGDIAFHGWEGGIPFQNFYHEIAHAIDNQAGGYFTGALNAQRVYAPDGTFVMGGPASNYQRNSLGYAESRILDPTGRDVDAQQHPGDAPCATGDTWCMSGNTSTEEWGDLVANYVAGNFDNDVGAIRQNWVSDVWEAYFLPISIRYLIVR